MAASLRGGLSFGLSGFTYWSHDVGGFVQRPLFFEYRNDPGSWTIDDQYLFGTDLLVAPMFTNGDRRRVYLPPGVWIDYQSGRVYQGAAWHEIQVGQIPVVLRVRTIQSCRTSGWRRAQKTWTGTTSSCAFSALTTHRRRDCSLGPAATRKR